MITETKIIARYAETDQMGVIHHSVYPIWYECARTDFIKRAGKSYSEMEDMGIMLPLLEVRCEYKSFAKYEDEINIKTYIKNFTPTRITFGYDLYKNGEERCINKGTTMHCWTNSSLRPINLKKHFPEVFNFLDNIQKHDEA